MIVKGSFDATGVHLGLPLPFTRAGRDFPSMYLFSNAFGKHRSFVGRLMRVVRESRGLNYGTYAYVEDFPNGGQYETEPTQVARTRQAFTVWGRPTPEENGCFVMRQIAREVDSLSTKGLTEEEFALGQSHLLGNIPLLGASLERSLGYRIDSVFYGIPGNYLEGLAQGVEHATLPKVNKLLKKYIRPADLHFVVVARDPEKFKKQILSPSCDVHYGPGVEKPKEVLAEDKEIAVYSLGIKPERITVVEAESVFTE
jgi:zinc protease